MISQNPKLACPICHGEFSGEKLLCLTCSREFPVVGGIIDLRLAISDEETGWDAEVFDQLYAACKFPDSKDDYKSLNIPFFAEEYRMRERDSFIIKRLRENSPQFLLDVGCGDGQFVGKISEYIPNTTFRGVDVSMFRLRRLNENIRLQLPDLKVFASNAEYLPFTNENFDIVLMREALEHCFLPEKALNEAYRVLKPGGHLIITTPSRTMFIFWKTAAFFPAILKRFVMGEKMIKATQNAFDRPLSSSRIKTCATKSGFTIQSWEKAILLPHESYLQFIPQFLLRAMIRLSGLCRNNRILNFMRLHHIIILTKFPSETKDFSSS